MRSQKWDRQAVPFLGPCLGSFFEVFCITVAEAQCFGFNEALWLMATGKAAVPMMEICAELCGSAAADQAMDLKQRLGQAISLSCS